MWTTFEPVKKITLSPSVWPCGKWIAWISSPLKWTESDSSKVMTGSAFASARPAIFSPKTVCSVDQALAHVVVGDDRRLGAEGRVAAGVVAVPVGVEHELELAGARALQRGADLVGERRELVVDDEDAVVARRDADVAARALQHVDVAGDLGRLDLHLREVPLLRRGGAGGQRQQQERALYPELAH